VSRGRVIVLNGTSSAGKSTLAQLLQGRFAAAGEPCERERGDRLVGLARSQYDIVHRHPAYDARIDTATTGPEAAAAALDAALSW
jgi:chloramphenicol 3-O-phosphotransferase